MSIFKMLHSFSLVFAFICLFEGIVSSRQACIQQSKIDINVVYPSSSYTNLKIICNYPSNIAISAYAHQIENNVSIINKIPLYELKYENNMYFYIFYYTPSINDIFLKCRSANRSTYSSEIIIRNTTDVSMEVWRIKNLNPTSCPIEDTFIINWYYSCIENMHHTFIISNYDHKWFTEGFDKLCGNITTIVTTDANTDSFRIIDRDYDSHNRVFIKSFYGHAIAMDRKSDNYTQYLSTLTPIKNYNHDNY